MKRTARPAPRGPPLRLSTRVLVGRKIVRNRRRRPPPRLRRALRLSGSRRGCAACRARCRYGGRLGPRRLGAPMAESLFIRDVWHDNGGEMATIGK